MYHFRSDYFSRLKNDAFDLQTGWSGGPVVANEKHPSGLKMSANFRGLARSIAYSNKSMRLFHTRTTHVKQLVQTIVLQFTFLSVENEALWIEKQDWSQVTLSLSLGE